MHLILLEIQASHHNSIKYRRQLLNATSPDGFNKAFFTQDSSTTQSTFWKEDPSIVGVPDMTFGAVSPPSSPTLSYSSYVPHYTEASGNAFSYGDICH